MKIAVTSDTHYGFTYKTRKIHQVFLEKLASEKFDVLVHCGDWISSKQSELPKTFEMFRKHIKCPILTVMGNHDLWNNSKRWKYSNKEVKRNYIDIIEYHIDQMRKYDIHHLDKTITLDDITFYGFDGWYKEVPPRTNDLKYMPRTAYGFLIEQFLNKKADTDLSCVLNKVSESQSNINICCTHHAPYTIFDGDYSMCANISYMEYITSNFDMFLVGHTHVRKEVVEDGCHVINPGSDYNNPKYIIVDTCVISKTKEHFNFREVM